MQSALATPEIPQPTGLPPVESRRDGRKQSGGDGRAPPPKRVVETYQEADRTKPADDRITIIGIPISQITRSTQAALAGLVAESATLRAQVRRLERQLATLNAPPMLGRDAFIKRLGEMTASAPEGGTSWILFLIHVQTYDDIRRSTGLLAANSVLSDVGQRLQHVAFTDGGGTSPLPVALVGSMGGLSLGLLLAAPETSDTTALAQHLHAQLTASGYDVAGLDMALAFKIAAASVAPGESPLLAIARIDHLSRGSNAVG